MLLQHSAYIIYNINSYNPYYVLDYFMSLLESRVSWNRWRRNKETARRINEGGKEGRGKRKKSVGREDTGKLQRNCISIRANCREVRENGRDRATNLFEGGNTRANKFPWGLRGEGEGEIPVRNPIRIGAAREGCRRHSSGKLREIREYSCRLYRRIRSGEQSLPPRY